jgi:mannose-6-phosphate isomerase-like protein (cupin superfamily)
VVRIQTPRSVRDASGWFEVLGNGEELQTAVMRLDPGAASGPMGNEHAGSEQVLFVVEGEVEGEIGERSFKLRAGESVIVPKGVAHRFRNAGSDPALTFNVYAPAAY